MRFAQVVITDRIREPVMPRQRLPVTVVRSNAPVRHIGQRIREVRLELGLTQGQLGKRANLATGTVSDLENERQTGTKQVVQLALALGVHAMWLVEERGPKYLKDAHAVREPTSSTHVLPEATVEERRFGAEWGKLDEPAKTQVRIMVESLVAQQIRQRRGKKSAKMMKELPN